MATDRVIEFMYDLVGNRELRNELLQGQHTSQAWLDVAKRAGYDFSDEDLRKISEEIVQKPLGKESYIPELVNALSPESPDAFGLSPHAIDRLKAIMQQGRFSGYYRPW
jgi:hypothetical protein